MFAPVLSLAFCVIAVQGQHPGVGDSGTWAIRKTLESALGLKGPGNPELPRGPHAGSNGLLRGPFPPGVRHPEAPRRLLRLLRELHGPGASNSEQAGIVWCILPHPSFPFSRFVPDGTVLFDLTEVPGHIEKVFLYVHHRGPGAMGHRPTFHAVDRVPKPRVQLFVLSEAQPEAHLREEYTLSRPEPNYIDWYRIDLEPALKKVAAELRTFLGVRVVDGRGGLLLNPSKLQPSPVFLELWSPAPKDTTALDTHDLAVKLLDETNYTSSAFSAFSDQDQELKRDKRYILDDLEDPDIWDLLIVRRLSRRRQGDDDEDERLVRQPRPSRTCQVTDLFINFKRIYWEKYIYWPKELPSPFCSGSCNLGSQGAWERDRATINNVLEPARLLEGGVSDFESRRRGPCAPIEYRPLKITYMVGIYRYATRTYPNMTVAQCMCTG